MKTQESPSLEDYQDGIPEALPDESTGHKRFWIVFGGLVVVIVALLGVKFLQTDIAAQLARRGTVSGLAMDEALQPITAEIYVFGTDIVGYSGADGAFEIGNVPAGERSIIVAYGDIAAEVTARVPAGGSASVGVVTVPTSLEIDD